MCSRIALKGYDTLSFYLTYSELKLNNPSIKARYCVFFVSLLSDLYATFLNLISYDIVILYIYIYIVCSLWVHCLIYMPHFSILYHMISWSCIYIYIYCVFFVSLLSDLYATFLNLISYDIVILYIYMYIYMLCLCVSIYVFYLWFHLTHWGRVTHICVGNLTIIGSDNGLSPYRRQAIICTNAGIC